MGDRSPDTPGRNSCRTSGSARDCIATVGLWGDTELATRIRTGAVVSDLLRPMHPVVTYLATDLGRAGFALLTRFVVPVIVGALAFDFYVPRHAVTYPLGLVSIALAVVVCFGCRYIVNAASYWLLDGRGALIAWTVDVERARRPLLPAAIPAGADPNAALGARRRSRRCYRLRSTSSPNVSTGADAIGLVALQAAWAVGILALAVAGPASRRTQAGGARWLTPPTSSARAGSVAMASASVRTAW